MPVTPIGPGPESVGVLLWAADPDAARWQRSSWGGARWSAPGWQSVGCDVGEVSSKWGAGQEAGILSTAEAGELDLVTIDPGRELDPLNASSPYYGATRPGTPLRIVGYSPGERILATAYIDELSYDVASARGRIRAIDGIAQLAQAQLPAGVSLPNTLRARVRAVVAAAGLGSIVPVQPEASSVQQLTDPSFEDPALAAWAASAVGAGSGSIASPDAATGARVLQVKGGAGGFPQYRQAIPAEAGGTYVLAGVTRWAAGAGAKGTLQLIALDGIGGTVASPLATSVVTDPTLWDPLTVSYTVPADGSVVSLRAVCLVNAASTTATDAPRFDDVTLTGPTLGSTLEPDPPVAPYDATNARPAWAVISDAALDALTYVWIDPTGTLSFRSWGALIDAPIAGVGCRAPDADPLDQWLAGLSTIEATAAGDGVRNSVRAYSAGTTWQPAATDKASLARYGPRPFDVERVVPGFATWSSRILADRGDAGLEVGLGDLRPYTVPELDALLATNLAGPSVLRVRDDAHGELIDLDVGMIGAKIGVTPAGWRWAIVSMISRIDWDAIDPTPPEPPIPPPDPWHVETRTYIASSDALIALTSGGSKYGAGAASSLPVGVWSGWTYRALLAFPAIPWTKVRAIRTATLKLQSSTQVRVGFGSSPKAQLLRITSGWSAGSASSPSSGNAVVWPGPSTTTSGAVTAGLTRTQNGGNAIRCDAIARAWAPASVGGSGAGQYGIELREVSSSTTNTGEVWPVEQGGAARPTLELVLEVFD